VRSLDDAVLDVDDDERGVRAVLERRHVDNLAGKYDRPVAAADDLKRVPLFSGLNDRQRRKLADVMCKLLEHVVELLSGVTAPAVRRG